METYAYIRVSTERQDLENQQYGVAEWCKSRGITLTEVFRDEVSGKKSWRERRLADLIGGMKKGDALIVPELSRISRSLQDTFDFLAEAARLGLVVRIIKGDFVVDGSLQSTVLVTAFGLAAQIEREFISQRTKEALARKKAEGQTLGRRKGSKSATNKLTGHEEMVLNYHKLGVSAAAISRMIKCHPATVRRWLSENKGKTALSLVPLGR